MSNVTHILGWPLSTWRRVFDFYGKTMPVPHPENLEPFLSVYGRWMEEGHPPQGLSGSVVL